MQTRKSFATVWGGKQIGGVDGGVPMLPVDFKKGPCRPVNFKKGLCRPVDFKKGPCRPVDFKKGPCRPVDFKKGPCRPVDLKKVLCRMSLRTKKDRVALSILRVHTPK